MQLPSAARGLTPVLRPRPLHRPVPRKHHRALPAAGDHREAYRFRACPWILEDAGSVRTSPLGATKSTVRDEKTPESPYLDNAAVDDGRLCDKGRFGFQMFHSEDRITASMLRQGGVLGQVSWDEALDTVASGLRATG